MKKIKIKIDYIDKEEKRQMKTGEVLETTEERADELIKAGLVEEIKKEPEK